MQKLQEKFLGLLMLNTQFPRFLGDIGHEKSFSFPVRKKIIAKASPERAIRQNPTNLLPDFINAARKLEEEGARLITTSCGFLCLFQKELDKALNIPVLTSSLFLWRELQKKYENSGRVGILTISQASLGQAHLASANIPPDTPIGSTEKGRHFTQTILSNSPTLDYACAEQDNVQAAMALQSRYPDLAAILLECTNMPPYAKAITQQTGLPVYSILDGINTLWQATDN